MRLFVDRTNTGPTNWVCVSSATDAIEQLRSSRVEEISLAHEIGDDEEGNGQTVLLWIEQAVLVGGYRPPIITIHSARGAARRKMEEMIRTIHQIAAAQNAR
jgi:hypothetical protein